MKNVSFNEAMEQILREDPRYDEHAYMFVRDALDHAIKRKSKSSERPGRHVSGAELLDSIRDYALKEFGPMAYTVLKHWGISGSEDFGNIVFNLVDAGILGKTDEDSREDFADGYDFDEVFRKPFLPGSSNYRTSPPETSSESRN